MGLSFDGLIRLEIKSLEVGAEPGLKPYEVRIKRLRLGPLAVSFESDKQQRLIFRRWLTTGGEDEERLIGSHGHIVARMGSVADRQRNGRLETIAPGLCTIDVTLLRHRVGLIEVD